MSDLLGLFDAQLLHSTIRSVTPILLAALGGLLCERAGVFNIGLEGLLLTGAFAAVAGSFWSGSALGGVVVAVLAGMLLAGLFSLLGVTLRGNVIVIGIAINLLAAGATVYLLRQLFDVRGTFQDPRLEGLPDIDLPLIADVPVVGDALSGHSPLVYLSWALVAVIQVLLFRHAIGLRLRGVGERPEAAETLGVRVRPMRHAALLASGALCGLGGAQLALGNVTLFAENMSAGRGWIAVVAVMLGQAHPLGVLGASLLFGLADTLGFRLQGLGLPQQATGAIPYLLTLLALVLAQARRRVAARPA